MATYSTLQTRVLANLIDTPSAVQSAVPRFINAAIRDAEQEHNFRVMEETVTATTAADTRNLVAVPSDFKEYRGFPYYTTNAGLPLPMEYLHDYKTVTMAFSTTTESFPHFIVRGDLDKDGAGYFEVWPLSDSGSDYDDNEYRITIPYWKYLADLSADGDTNWFTTAAELYIEFKATAYGFAMDWDLTNEAAWLAKAEQEKAKLIKADKRLRLSTTETLVPKTGPYSLGNRYGWSRRWPL